MDTIRIFNGFTLPSTTELDEYVLFYQVYAKIPTFFDQEKFGRPTTPLLYVDVETFGGN